METKNGKIPVQFWMEKLAKRSQAKKYKADMEKILNKKPEISEQKPAPIIIVEPL